MSETPDFNRKRTEDEEVPADADLDLPTLDEFSTFVESLGSLRGSEITITNIPRPDALIPDNAAVTEDVDPDLPTLDEFRTFVESLSSMKGSEMTIADIPRPDALMPEDETKPTDEELAGINADDEGTVPEILDVARQKALLNTFVVDIESDPKEEPTL